jgi:hypothetical protein
MSEGRRLSAEVKNDKVAHSACDTLGWPESIVVLLFWQGENWTTYCGNRFVMGEKILGVVW